LKLKAVLVEGDNKMKEKISLFLFILLLGMGLLSCAGHYRVMVMYDRAEGLKSGDRVYWENKVIGSVGSLETNSRGRTLVPLTIKNDFRYNVTNLSRFLIQADPNKPGNQSVTMVQLKGEGKPLPDGSVVEGSTSFSIMLEKGNRELLGWSKLFQDAVDRLEKEFRRLAKKEWQKELEEQMDGWIRELKRSGEDVRRYFQKEVLPRLEQAVKDSLQWLKEQGKEKDGQPLEEKLEELKRTLDS